MLSGAPYGYRYVRKTGAADAYYAVIESEAEVVREVFELYAKELWSIARSPVTLTSEKFRRDLSEGPGKDRPFGEC